MIMIKRPVQSSLGSTDYKPIIRFRHKEGSHMSKPKTAVHQQQISIQYLLLVANSTFLRIGRKDKNMLNTKRYPNIIQKIYYNNT